MASESALASSRARSERGPLACGTAVGAGLLLLGCVSVADRLAELKKPLIGMDARVLRDCVGVPASVDVVGDKEVQVYRFTAEETLAAVERDRFPSSLPRPNDPRRRIPPDESLLESQRNLPGFCELTFELREGRVEGVNVRGRRASGLNDDVGCLQRTETCRADR